LAAFLFKLALEADEADLADEVDETDKEMAESALTSSWTDLAPQTNRRCTIYQPLEPPTAKAMVGWGLKLDAEPQCERGSVAVASRTQSLCQALPPRPCFKVQHGSHQNSYHPPARLRSSTQAVSQTNTDKACFLAQIIRARLCALPRAPVSGPRPNNKESFSSP
jgi:hypothetical protein